MLRLLATSTDAPFVSCTRCGERLFVPEASEYSDARNVRHRWKCEAVRLFL
jgi:hypothetical protein